MENQMPTQALFPYYYLRFINLTSKIWHRKFGNFVIVSLLLLHPIFTKLASIKTVVLNIRILN